MLPSPLQAKPAVCLNEVDMCQPRSLQSMVPISPVAHFIYVGGNTLPFPRRLDPSRERKSMGRRTRVVGPWRGYHSATPGVLVRLSKDALKVRRAGPAWRAAMARVRATDAVRRWTAAAKGCRGVGQLTGGTLTHAPLLDAFLILATRLATA
jgi:hypothetical protein